MDPVDMTQAVQENRGDSQPLLRTSAGPPSVSHFARENDSRNTSDDELRRKGFRKFNGAWEKI